MKTEHTPGPWSFYTSPQPNGCPIVGSGGLMVAMLAHSVNHPDQRETALANASLIAQAPTLLRLLKRITDNAYEIEWDAYGLNNYEDFDVGETIKEAKEAIARATGEEKP